MKRDDRTSENSNEFGFYWSNVERRKKDVRRTNHRAARKYRSRSRTDGFSLCRAKVDSNREKRKENERCVCQNVVRESNRRFVDLFESRNDEEIVVVVFARSIYIGPVVGFVFVVVMRWTRRFHSLLIGARWQVARLTSEPKKNKKSPPPKSNAARSNLNDWNLDDRLLLSLNKLFG